METATTRAGSEGQTSTGPLSPEAARIAALEAEVRGLDEERQTLRDRLLRLAADFENWKKRAEKEKAEAQRQAREPVLLDLVAAIDGLERGLASLQETHDPRAVREGVNLVLRQLQQTLARHGVTPIEAAGQLFDPSLHDAVARAPSRDVDPGTVLSEVQKGYMIGDRLLRPASVIVSETAEPPAQDHPPD
jgi:molecular chaperone GrpE